MPRSPRRIARFSLMAAVCAGLAFGTQTALAGPVQATCPIDYGSGRIGQSCTQDAAGNALCDKQCKRIFGPFSPGFCAMDSCCLCGI